MVLRTKRKTKEQKDGAEYERKEKETEQQKNQKTHGRKVIAPEERWDRVLE